MKAIIGLGNPGVKHENTRHNLGFMFLDYLAQEWQFPRFSVHNKFDAAISEGIQGDEKILLVKPQTFMNLSGTSVEKIISFYKISSENIVVVHDDIDIVRGDYRMATDSSSAGHNGVQNIIDTLKTKRFFRFRIGIGQSTEEKEVCKIGTHDYVLGKLSPEELSLAKPLFARIKTDLENQSLQRI